MCFGWRARLFEEFMRNAYHSKQFVVEKRIIFINVGA
jgi:hypothetical protein